MHTRTRQKTREPSRQVLLGGDAVAEIQERLQGSQPKAQIKQLQRDTAIPETLPILPLIDLMGKSRLQFHAAALSHLRVNLLQRIPNMDQDELGTLLMQTFPYIQFDELQPISLEILKRHHNIPHKILRHLRDNKPLLEKCTLDVKRQVWQYDDVEFVRELQPLLHDYAGTYAKSWIQQYVPRLAGWLNDAQSAVTVPPETEASKQHPKRDITPLTDKGTEANDSTDCITRLLDLTGLSQKLYTRLLDYLRLCFAQTGDACYCHLRMALVVAVTERHASALRVPSSGSVSLSRTSSGSLPLSSTTTAYVAEASNTSLSSTGILLAPSTLSGMGPILPDLSTNTTTSITDCESASIRSIVSLLHSALNNNKLGSQQFSQVFEHLTKYKENDSELGDLGMIFRSPEVTLLFCRSVLNQLIAAVDRYVLPRDAKRLMELTQILGTGYRIRDMIETESFRYPGVALEVIEIIYPLFAIIIGEDVLYDERIRRAREAARYQQQNQRPGDDNQPFSNGPWRAAVEMSDNRTIPSEVLEYAQDIYYLEILLALYVSHRATAGDITRMIQALPGLISGKDTVYTIIPSIRNALHSILSSQWSAFLLRRNEMLDNFLEPLSSVHASLHLLVLDFLDRAPPGIENDEFRSILARLANHGAVCRRMESASSALNGALRELYQQILQEKHISEGQAILKELEHRLPAVHKQENATSDSFKRT